MPIKACTRCGLKVLVDASVAASDTYLCPRCAPDVKPASSSKPGGGGAGGGKRPSIKVSCPYCGASFSGSMPSRPAKGGCPVCQKELVLLPDGTIQAAATFNLAVWQKERESKKGASNPPSAPAPAAVEAPPEMPSTPDPLGGSTILDMGGPPAGVPPPEMPSLDEPTIPMTPGLGGESMLGMGQGMDDPPPAPTIDEPLAPPPDPYSEEIAGGPPDLGGATILDMGSRPVDLPPPDIEDRSPPPDLLKDTMPGMDRPPSAESPVAPPTPPPIPEEHEVDVTEGPTIRDQDAAPPEEEPAAPPMEPEPEPSSIESTEELPADLGGQTILGMDLEPRQPEPAPSIEEPPPEAVPILAKDVPSTGDLLDPDAPADAEEATPKPYIYQPIPRKARAATPAPAGPPTPLPMAIQRGPAIPGGGPPPPPPAANAPVLGSDFRIAAAPPPPKPVEKSRDEKKVPAGPRTAAIILPRAQHSVGKLVLGWVLLLLPVLVVFLLHTMQKNPSVEGIIQKVTNQALPGIRKMEGEIRKAVTKPAETPPETK